MDGAHDMGGAPWRGPVRPEANEPPFHAGWERRAFALTLAMATPGGWNLDMSRFARENRPREDYLGKSYYEIWLAGLEQLMQERDLLRPGEIEAGKALHPVTPVKRILTADQVEPVLRRGGPTERPAAGPALFAPGERVRAKNMHPPTHTRLPNYVRGHIGRVEAARGAHVFPDSHAQGLGEDPQWLYTVVFTAGELWPGAPEPGLTVSVDAWEPYLERA
jgi:nitrile hydratase